VLPNFLVIGAAKAGTTSLWVYLREHPQVFMSDPKELHFFVADMNWGRGLEWYESHFEGAGDAIAIGEACGAYARYPNHRSVPERIAEVVPEAKLIYLVRHPIERMISNYILNVQLGVERERSVERALLADPQYLDASRYAMQIEQYLPYFEREKMLIIQSEDLSAGRSKTMERTFAFLGVGTSWVPDNLDQEYNITRTKVNRAVRPTARAVSRKLQRLPGYPALASRVPTPVRNVKRRLATTELAPAGTISDAARRELEDQLRPDVERLRNFMGSGFDGWGIA
jgi:sulfotransferase family protein